jgi:hypothetical protein
MSVPTAEDYNAAFETLFGSPVPNSEPFTADELKEMLNTIHSYERALFKAVSIVVDTEVETEAIEILKQKLTTRTSTA